MERQIPKNVRQIGNVSDSPKIYVEDYVDTFFAQLCEKSEKAKVPIGAFLVGDIQSGDDEEYVYIYGAIQMHDLKLSGNEYVIDDSTWKHAYEDCKQFFEDGEMLGWFVAHPGVPLSPEASTVKLHKKSFPKKNTVFIMKDPVEKDETYYVHKMNDLMEIGGHYTYYEKNPCMQNYMISSRKKNGAISSETVEDRAAQDFRDLVRKRGEHQKRRKAGGMMYVASACLVLVLIIMGVSMVNSFDRMKSVQSTLEALADTSDTVETRETSGSVTAVTSEEQAGDGQASEEDEAQSNENQSAEPQLAENQPDGSQSDDVQTASSDAESSGTSETDSAAENQSTAYTGENGSDGVYVVEEGDTLAIISRKMYGDVSHVDAICRMNGITDGNLIYVGQKLLLP
ncbi:MAG TPA: LysM peptidoglycan-binding domain-containing protein [Candidatus Mediterraneibacter ornithocaccae]|jgi:LysM repeat protein|uniref:LysM peptidoglycan-binding domain-containing protein n=1 Tax=Mediterraneibacter glycyrrhizinilyticus TaxID=342942 RepID=UPI001F98B2EC|nr:LysM peptidoglycan-binding domain-containing protein [Mediterraneibacter glycyrrhizinilyticus]MDN0060126.1 LysM peptidoglycan-binding domain-containing protein [Mediterraneibacter glycyrrhizinilyticus]HJA20062.1 LysM peptidoglycan-binding domain-containing protein [Candidatus Mediterraneibacter ornithocaccae]